MYICGTDEAVQDLWLAFGYSSGDVIVICHVMGMMGMSGMLGKMGMMGMMMWRPVKSLGLWRFNGHGVTYASNDNSFLRNLFAILERCEKRQNNAFAKLGQLLMLANSIVYNLVELLGLDNARVGIGMEVLLPC